MVRKRKFKPRGGGRQEVLIEHAYAEGLQRTSHREGEGKELRRGASFGRGQTSTIILDREFGRAPYFAIGYAILVPRN